MTTTTLIHPGPTDEQGEQPHTVQVHAYDDGRFQLSIGSSGHAPRYTERMSRAQVRRLAYAMLSAAEAD